MRETRIKLELQLALYHEIQILNLLNSKITTTQRTLWQKVVC